MSNGSFEEGDSTFLALIGHHLHEGDARGIIDAHMNELPTDAVMTVDRAGISPSDAMSNRADPAELLDIDVDELTRLLSFVAPDWFSRLQGTQFIQS